MQDDWDDEEGLVAALDSVMAQRKQRIEVSSEGRGPEQCSQVPVFWALYRSSLRPLSPGQSKLPEATIRQGALLKVRVLERFPLTNKLLTSQGSPTVALGAGGNPMQVQAPSARSAAPSRPRNATAHSAPPQHSTTLPQAQASHAGHSRPGQAETHLVLLRRFRFVASEPATDRQ